MKMKHCLFALLILMPMCGLTAAEKPNILFIAIDDLNDWVGPLNGHPQVQTPHMDQLAKRGTTFTNAHCQSPLCNPSRTSLMTGLRPSTTGIYGLAPWIRNVEDFADRVTLPQYLGRHGYKTYSTGKIYHGGYGRRDSDDEFDTLGPPASVGARPEEKLVTTPFGNHPLVDWGHFPHQDEEKGDYRVASWAVDRLNDMPEDQPFFLSVGFFLPHVPCYATEKWFELYPQDELQLPPVLTDDRADTPRFSWYLHWELPEVRLKWLKEQEEWNPLVRSYLACISFVDSQVGRVLEALESNDYADNTVVVLWSDHGWHLGEKAITGKNTLWERSTRVPLIFAGPGISREARCAEAVELLDLYPTLVELAALPEKEGLEGHSLVPQLKDPDASRPWPAITTHNQGNHTIRTERWRYIRYADGSEELYDMEEDPNEFRNLIGQERYGDQVAELRQWIPEVDLPPAPGSRARILTYDKETDTAVWEGERVLREDAIPGL
jgi:arylsulfatase A-like enzyme